MSEYVRTIEPCRAAHSASGHQVALWGWTNVKDIVRRCAAAFSVADLCGADRMRWLAAATDTVGTRAAPLS